MIKAIINFKLIEQGSPQSYIREIESDERSELENRIEEMIETIMLTGYLDDKSSDKWTYIPPSRIDKIEIEFKEETDERE